ncbi:MAG TPA: YbhB/YbcL family Raf kinase inhibitor-like protein [Flavisolibacter sp.]
MQPIQSIEASKARGFRVLQVSSPSFDDGGNIPATFTCEGRNASPPILIRSLPAGTMSIAIIMDDPDAPAGTWTHWVNWNIPATHQLREGESKGVIGKNSYGRNRYDGPCPPSGVQRYHFRIFALDCILDITGASGAAELEKSIADHILAVGILHGKYRKQRH